MRKPLLGVLRWVALSLSLVAFIGAGVCLSQPTRRGGGGRFRAAQLAFPRVNDADVRQGPAVEKAFKDVGALWPPTLYLRAFKLESRFEIWAKTANGSYVLVEALPICMTSGGLGPKRRQGDGQVPEGFYTLDRFNPRSSYHLSLGVDYPNAVDRARGQGGPLGGDIFVHGKCVTIGCLPLEDLPMERVYLAAVAARDAGQATLPIHLFPCRFNEPACQTAVKLKGAASPELAAFWDTLKPAFEAFEATHRPPRVAIRQGRYHLAER